MVPKPQSGAEESAMPSKPSPASLPFSSDTLDQLFSDCATLETLVASIRQAMAELNPGVDSGAVTAEHLMNLAFRIENAERGLITVAHQISDTATSVIDHRKLAATVH